MSNFITKYNAKCQEKVDIYVYQIMDTMITFISLGAHFGTNTQALTGMSKFFMRMAEVEFRDAQEFIRYQNMHGGVMTFYEIHQAYSPPEHPITSWRAAQQMEEEHVDKLEEIHAEAIKQNASEFGYYVNKKMQKRISAYRMITEYLVQLERVGPDIGLHYFDYELEDQIKDID